MLHFGILNGVPNGDANADFTFSFKDLANNNIQLSGSNPVIWEVKNDEAVTNQAGCSATNGNDCYQWDSTKNRAKGKWSWGSSKTSGGILGPLPAYNFCIVITAGDVSGITSYEFSSYDGGVYPLTAKPFDGAAFDYDLKMCAYECPVSTTCVQPTPGIVGNTDGTTGTTAGGTTAGSNGNSGSGGTSSGGASSGGTSSGGSSSGGGTSGGSSSTSSSGSSSSSSGSSSSANGGGSGSTTTTTTTGATGGNGDKSIGSGTSMSESDNDGATGSGRSGGLSPSSMEDGNVGGIVGGIVGGLFGCLLIVGLILFVHNKQQKNKKTNALPKGWTSFLDETTGYTCYVDPNGDSHWDHPNPTTSEVEMSGGVFENPMRKGKGKHNHSRNETDLPQGWNHETTDEGDKYYQHENGETAWEAPPGSVGGSAGGVAAVGIVASENELGLDAHQRTETVMPEGWKHETTEEGDKYYQHENGETAWEAPEGSTGGSTGV